MENDANPKALLPIAVFVILYVSLGLILEYGLKVDLGFYSVPIVGVFMIALVVAYVQNKRGGFDEKMEIMAKGVGNPNILTMVLIFLCAGVFIGIVGRSGAQSMAYLFLDTVPPEYAVLAMFVIAMAVSISMGTSVGTITLIGPIAVTVADVSGFSVPVCIGAVVGGAMFGDNLSFISDTTIAACQGLGCSPKDKFRENIIVALPAAVLSMILVAVLTLNDYSGGYVHHDYKLLFVIPYLLVFVCSLLGMNVFKSLILGMVSGLLVIVADGGFTLDLLLGNIKVGIESMYETIAVTILVSACLGLVIDSGGFKAILKWIKETFRSRKGGMIGIGILGAVMDVSTANNTVAIVMSNPLAKEISESYGVSLKRAASILDSFSCIMQGIIPYGAQILVATAAVSATLGASVYSPLDIVPYTIYPLMLLLTYLVYIIWISDRSQPTN